MSHGTHQDLQDGHQAGPRPQARPGVCGRAEGDLRHQQGNKSDTELILLLSLLLLSIFTPLR